MHGDFGPNAITLAQRLVSQSGRLGATRIYQAPAVGSVANGATSQAVPITWRTDGIVIAMYGQTLDGAVASLAGMALRVQLGGSEDLFTDGNTGVAVPMLSLFGQAQNWFPLMRQCYKTQVWSVSFTNTSGGALTPSVQFAVIEKPGT